MQYLFQEVASQFKSSNHYDKFIKQAVKEFDIQTYRLHLFPVSQALFVYKKQCLKYENKAFEARDCAWHDNERRVYVWFIVGYVHYKLLDANKLLDSQKHWNRIREAFWGKDVYFLKYQLQTIIKNRGRITWGEKQDLLLRDICPKYQNGKWNQIAKDFYFRTRGQCFKTAKQCRQRWQNHLKHSLEKGEWTPQQLLILFQQVKKNGTKWARIIPLLKDLRNQHTIKNKYKAQISKVMKGNNIGEIEAVDLIIRNITDGSMQRPDQEEEMKVQANNRLISEEIAFFQSQEVFDEDQEIKQEVQAKKKKSGRRKVSQKKGVEDLDIQEKELKIKGKEPIETGMSLLKSSTYDKYEIQGCKVIGSSMAHINQYLYVHRSDSFSQSNSNSKSLGIPNFFNSAKFSGSYSIDLSNRSLMPLEAIAFKEDKNEKNEKKQLEFESIKSLRSNSSRLNESVFFRSIN